MVSSLTGSGQRAERRAGQEGVRLLAAQPQRARDQPQLRGVLVVGRGRRAVGVEPGQQGAPGVPVDRPAVVGIDERQVDQVGPLVGVGHPGRGQLHQLLRQQRRHPARAQRVDEGLHLGGEGVVGQHGAHEALEGLVVVGVRVGPRRPGLGLAGGLLGVGDRAVDRQRPGADEGLVEEVLLGPVRQAARARGRVVRGPGRDGVGPLARALRQQGHPDADVLGALRVVRRQGGHRHRPVALQGRAEVHELLRAGAEAARVAADLVQRDEPAVAVEGGVLDALGHDRAAGLLEAAGELRPQSLLLALAAGQSLGQRQVADQVDDDRVGLLPSQARGVLHLVPGGRVGRPPVGGDVGAVDLEGREHLDQPLLQGGAGVVAVLRHEGADRAQQVDEPGDLAAQHLAQHQVLGVVHDDLPVGVGRGELAVQGGERVLGRRVDEQAEDVVEHVVAGRPGAGPGVRQHLRDARLQDLLHHDPGVAARLGQSDEVALGIGQAVRVVDAQAVQHPAGELVEHQPVGLLEDGRVLDAHAREGRHVEEPPVVQLLTGGLPVRDPVVLRVEQREHVARAAPRSRARPGRRGRSSGPPSRAPRRPRP